MTGYMDAYNKAKEEGKLVALTPTFIKWSKENDLVVGKFLKKEEVLLKGEPQGYYHYVFETDAGAVSFNLGAHVEEKLDNPLDEGKVYVVKYLGKQETAAGNRVNRFAVQELVIQKSSELPPAVKPKTVSKETAVNGKGNKAKN